MNQPRALLLGSTLLLGGACASDKGTGPGSITHLVVHYCASAAPLWGAFQNEGGAWTRLDGLASGTLEFDATERFTLALVRQDGENITTEVTYTSAAAIVAAQATSAPPVCSTLPTKSVSGSMTGVGSGQFGIVTMGMGFASTSGSGSFTMRGVRDGPLDLIASRQVSTSTTAIADRIVIRRALNPAVGQLLAAIDLSSAEAQDVTATTLSLNGVASGETGSIYTSMTSANGSFHGVSARFTLSASQPMHSVPAALLIAGDYHALDAQSWASDGVSLRSVSLYYHAPRNLSVSLGAPLAPVSVTTVASSPNLRVRLSVASQTDYSNQMTLDYRQGSRGVVLSALAGHFRGAPSTWTIEVPDFSAVDGWQADWGLHSGVAAEWTVSAFGPSPQRVSGIPVDGSMHRWALRFGGS